MTTKKKDDDVIVIDDVDFDEEDVIEVVDDKDEAPVKMVEDEPLDIEDIINKAMTRQNKAINKAVSSLNKRVDEHDERIVAIEKQQKEILKQLNMDTKTKEDIIIDEEDNRNIFDKTLGAVGGIMHGVVDTAAFVLESTVDLVTLGRAKREY